jgi:hypothetical protein
MRRERTEALNQALAGLETTDQRLLEQAIPALESLAEHLRDRPA